MSTEQSKMRRRMAVLRGRLTFSRNAPEQYLTPAPEANSRPLASAGKCLLNSTRMLPESDPSGNSAVGSISIPHRLSIPILGIRQSRPLAELVQQIEKQHPQ